MAPETKPEISGMGHAMKRKEDPRFLHGKGRYVDDIQLPGMLHMDIVRSPYAHATIKGIDTARALEVPGVLAVITGAVLITAATTIVDLVAVNMYRLKGGRPVLTAG